MNRRALLLASMAAAAFIAISPVRAEDVKEINFGILATEGSENLKKTWTPFLEAMAKQTGLKVNGFYGPDYSASIEAMRFNKIQVAHFGNASAIQAVDRAEGEVFAKQLNEDGTEGYYSLLIVNKDSPIQSLDDVLKAPGKFSFGNGDPNSTSGFAIPGYYAWAKNNIDIRKHFTRVITGSHEVNQLAVANAQVDVATNNTEDMETLHRNKPDAWAKIRVIWKSPIIPSDPYVWRKDLPADIKAKIKAFFLSYGKTDEEKKILAGIQYSGFKESTNAQLNGVRQINLFKDRIKVEADDKLSAEDKAAKLKDIDAKLAEIAKQSASN